MDYYDGILVLIPLGLLAFSGALLAGGVALTTAVPLAATVSAGMIGHALFVNGPVDPVPTPEQA